MKNLLLIFVFISSIASEPEETSFQHVVLSSKYNEISGIVKEELSVIVNVEKYNHDKTVLNLSLSTDIEGIVEFSKSTLVYLTEDDDGKTIEIKIMAKHPGVTTLFIQEGYESNVLDSKVNIRISIGRSKAIYNFSRLIGWCYVIAWNLASYPQLLKNFRRKSVVGIHFDYLGFNTLGHTSYMIYNIGLFTVPVIKLQYQQHYPNGINPVRMNDVFFAIHSVACCMLAIYQVYWYERGTQTLSLTCKLIVAILFLIGIDRLYLCLTSCLEWLDFIYYLSKVKIFITLLKYTPQVYFNFKRRSTHGMAIQNQILDFTGGILSVFQMILLAWDHDDWNSLYGNLAKFSLGLISILFDVMLLLQHYVLYRIRETSGTQAYKQLSQIEEDGKYRC